MQTGAEKRGTTSDNILLHMQGPNCIFEQQQLLRNTPTSAPGSGRKRARADLESNSTSQNHGREATRTHLGESGHVDRGQDPLLRRRHAQNAAAEKLAHRPRRRLRHRGIDDGLYRGRQPCQHGQAPPAADPLESADIVARGSGSRSYEAAERVVVVVSSPPRGGELALVYWEEIVEGHEVSHFVLCRRCACRTPRKLSNPTYAVRIYRI